MMNFLYPNILYALALVAIPIIIHFFNFRRYKKQEFTNVLLLKKAQKVNKSFNKLKSWLILLWRVLAIIALVFAFAQPTSKNFIQNPTQGKLVSIYIDNSFSMATNSQDGELLEIAKQNALAILNIYDNKDLFRIVTNEGGFNAPFIEKDLIKDKISSISLNPQSISLDKLLTLTRLEIDNDKHEAYFISDFQKNTVLNYQSTDLKDSVDYKCYWLPIQTEFTSNISIDSVWFEQPLLELNQVAELHIRLLNHSNEAKNEISTQVFVNNQQRGISTVSIDKNSQENIIVNYKITDKGWNELKVIVDDYPIEFDNEYFYTYFVQDIHRVLIVSDANKNNHYLKSAFATEDGFELKEISENELTNTQLNQYSLIVLNQNSSLSQGKANLLSSYIELGGNVFYIPNEKNPQNDKSFLQAFHIKTKGIYQTQNITVSGLNTQNEFFNKTFDEIPKNVLLPKAKKYLPLEPMLKANLSHILKLPNGLPFIGQFANGAGFFYSSAVPLNLEFSNYPKNPLFLPILFKMATYSNKNIGYAGFIGSTELKLAAGKINQDDVFVLKNSENELIPHQRFLGNILAIKTNDAKLDASFYRLTTRAIDSTIAKIGLNYNRDESNLTVLSSNELNSLAESIGAILLDLNNKSIDAILSEKLIGKTYWKWFIWATLLFLLLEILTIKLFKK